MKYSNYLRKAKQSLYMEVLADYSHQEGHQGHQGREETLSAVGVRPEVERVWLEVERAWLEVERLGQDESWVEGP